MIGQSTPDDATEAAPQTSPPAGTPAPPEVPRPKEYGGQEGPDPIRYGDWEKNGRCTDF